MEQRPQFRRAYILKEFNKLADKIIKRTKVFMIGGGALAFYDLKEGTKDVDVIVQTPIELKALSSALPTIDYHIVIKPTREYEEIGASIIVENPDGFRWDIFHMQVMNALTLSKNMVSRSTTIFKKRRLTVHQLSKEDLFVFKSITERPSDLEDMRAIAEAGLNWEIVLQEIVNQSDASGRLWENALYENLRELKNRYGIASPIEKKVENILAQKLDELEVMRQIKNGKKTVNGIATNSEEMSASLVRKALKRLEEKGKITIDRKKRPFVIHLE